jgi:exopolyphosphatase/guanosine-5'-triphosphate,3'-diphosphate pyrophosphatase
VRNVLVDYRREAEALGAVRTVAVATSAVRDAENGEAFLGEVEWSYGFLTRLLSGDEEAALTRRGLGDALTDGTLVVDVGGGSTELITADFRRSLDVGSVRLTERFGTDLDAAAAHVRSLLPDLAPRRAVGVDGTTAELVAMAGREDVTTAEVDSLLERLAAATPAERRDLLVEQPDRGDVIVGGVVVLREVLRRYELPGIALCRRDLLTGAALAAAELPDDEEGAAPPGAFTCC